MAYPLVPYRLIGCWRTSRPSAPKQLVGVLLSVVSKKDPILELQGIRKVRVQPDLPSQWVDEAAVCLCVETVDAFPGAEVCLHHLGRFTAVEVEISLRRTTSVLGTQTSID